MDALNVTHTFRRRLKKDAMPVFWMQYEHQGEVIQRTFPESQFNDIQKEYA